MNESPVWAEFTEDGLSLFHTVSVELAHVGVRGSTLKGTQSHGWQACAACWLAASPGLWAVGLRYPQSGLLCHGWLGFRTMWQLNPKNECLKTTRWKCTIFLWPSVTCITVTACSDSWGTGPTVWRKESQIHIEHGMEDVVTTIFGKCKTLLYKMRQIGNYDSFCVQI